MAERDGRVLGALQGFEQWVAGSDIGWVKKRRGRTQAFLGVEVENPTGARTFYERIGMIQANTQTTHRRTFS